MLILLSLLSLAHAETLYAVAPVEGLRWPGATQVTVRLDAGADVEVVLRDGGLVRVRKGGDFGWVAEASLTATAPAPALELDLPFEVPPTEAPPSP